MKWMRLYSLLFVLCLLLASCNGADGTGTSNSAKRDTIDEFTITDPIEDGTTTQKQLPVDTPSSEETDTSKADPPEIDPPPQADSLFFDASKTCVALMDAYKPTLGKTAYSGLTVESIKATVKTGGVLTVSKVPVSEVVAGNVSTVREAQSFALDVGTPTLFLRDFTLGEDETILLGAEGDSAILRVANDVTATLPGHFSDLSEDTLISAVEGVANCLLVTVNIASSEDVAEAMPGTADTIAAVSSYQPVKLNAGPFAHGALDAYANMTVDHIDVYAKSVTAMDAEQYMTVYLVSLDNAKKLGEYRFYADHNDLTSLTPEKVITLRAHETVRVGVGETLIFSAQNDPLYWGYALNLKGVLPTNGFLNAPFDTPFAATQPQHLLAINVYGFHPFDWDVHLNALQKAEENAANPPETPKKLSILGDSISTYSGYSDSTAVNNTLGGHNVWYNSSKLSVSDTWWMQAITEGGMELLVNNSFSGSWVNDGRPNAAGYNTRPDNLHDNTLENNPEGKPVTPDIIAVYLGINDLWNDGRCNDITDEDFWKRIEAPGFRPATFDEGYALMIYKITQNYPDADVFCFTIPHAKGEDRIDLNLLFNDVIKSVAAHYKCEVVDLYDTELSRKYQDYTIDNLHPTKEGMDIMTEAFLEAVYEASHG